MREVDKNIANNRFYVILKTEIMKIEKKSQVCIKALGKTRCEVVDPPDARGILVVTTGNARLRVHLDEVVELFGKKTLVSSTSFSVSKNIPEEIDVHELNCEEAWRKIQLHFDDVIAAGFRETRIVHGKGLHNTTRTATLKHFVRKKLSIDARVKSWEKASQFQGGDGATNVFFAV